LQLVVWLVPSLIAGAVCVSFIGVFMGPLYPIVMLHASKILPHWLLTGAIGLMGGLGAAGSAAIPFMTGAIASKAGIACLQPVYVCLSLLVSHGRLMSSSRMIGGQVLLLLLWLFVPKTPQP
jgi:fucose permease